MLAIERRREILLRLGTDGKVIVATLARDFGVTEETIRRDLEKLDNEGLVSKTYGGAVARQNNAVIDLPHNVRESMNVAEKERIATLVADLVQDGERIMVDPSSTALYIVRKLKSKKNLTVITNSVKVLLELSDKQDWTVLSTGGMLKKGALSLNGSSAEKMIASYHVDTVICSCKGIDTELGITDSTEQDCLIKQAMLAAAERRILAIDAGKFDRKSFVRVCGPSSVDIMVTDRDPGERWHNYCMDTGIHLVY